MPDLAVSLPTPTDGGKTYTFKLRRGIRYSNGRPVKASDFRRALERYLEIGRLNSVLRRDRGRGSAASQHEAL